MYEMGQKEIDAVARVIRKGQLFRYRGGEGGECDQFERALCERLKCKHALLLSQGTNALICGLVGLDIGPGDEVIVPAYTFMASPLGAVALGAVPVIAEIDESLTIDPRDVERKITKRTKAIIPVHMGGLPSKMDELVRIAKKHKIKIIEDACQAAGGSYKGRRLGTIGEAGAFSFNQFKIISCGEGGALVTSDKMIYHKALIHSDGGCAFRGHDLSAEIFCGWGSRVSEIQGAIMNEQLKRLDGILGRLRPRKQAMSAALRGSSHYEMSPVNCVKGDCSTITTVLFENEKITLKVMDALKKEKIAFGRPFDSGIHVCWEWKPILEQRGSGHPRRDAFKLAGRNYTYSKDMCPNSRRILSCSLMFFTEYKKSVAENRKSGATIRKVIENA